MGLEDFTDLFCNAENENDKNQAGKLEVITSGMLVSLYEHSYCTCLSLSREIPLVKAISTNFNIEASLMSTAGVQRMVITKAEDIITHLSAPHVALYVIYISNQR
jgi:hypothetical protein